MNRMQGLMRGAVWSVVLLSCSALAPDARAFAQGNRNLRLRVDGSAVSADIDAEPLAKVARALELKTGVTIHFPAFQGNDQVVTVRFEKLSLIAALRAIFENTNYAIVTRTTKQGVGIQAYVYPKRSEDASTHNPVNGKTEENGRASALLSQPVERRATEPGELLAPVDVVDPDPAVRLRKLEETVASYGPQSLALILASVHDADPLLRSGAEHLLLNELRDGVPTDVLSTIALSSEQVAHRLQALETVAERSDQSSSARMTLEGALHDTDPEVRQRAEGLLQRFSAPESERSTSQKRTEPAARSSP